MGVSPWYFSNPLGVASTVVLKFSMSSSNSSDSLTPQVEIEHQGTAFTNTPNYTGSAMSYTGTAVTGTVTIPGIGGGNYLWQARVANSAGQSSWVSMGGNPDFTVDYPPAANNSSAPTCGDSVTTGVPNLFEIRTTKNTATLYFAPPVMPHSNFYISYSSKPNVWQYGVQFDQGSSGGVLKYTINKLSPNTKYYFMIRAGNGCATGKWGNVMSAVTGSSNQTKTYYKNVLTAFVQQVKTVISNLSPKNNTSNLVATPNPTSTPKPIMEIQTLTPLPIQTQPASKPKFCILWWCF